jgi:hypothetical protein
MPAALSNPQSSSSRSGSLDQITLNYTLSAGSNRVLVVGFCGEATSPTGGTVTFGGVSLTEIEFLITNSGFANFVSMFVLLEADFPATETQDIVADLTWSSGGTNALSIVVGTLTDVAQAVPSGTAIGTDDNLSTVTASITSTADGAILVDVYGNGNGSSPTAAGGQTEDIAVTSNSISYGLSHKIDAVAGSDTMSWSATSSSREGIVAAAFSPTAGGGPTPHPAGPFGSPFNGPFAGAFA